MAEVRGWQITPTGLAAGDEIEISFQRYLVKDAPPLPAIPKSLGALEPHALAELRFVIPVHDGEAIWLGFAFGPVPRELCLKVRSACGWHDRLVRPSEPGAREQVAGFVDMKGVDCRFGSAGGCTRLEIDPCIPGVGCAQIAFVAPRTFEDLAGRAAPPPARPEDGYGDWRLP